MTDRLIDPAGWLVEKIIEQGLEEIFNRFYGIYRGKVIDDKDPEKRGRVRVLIPDLGHTVKADVPADYWAEVSSNFFVGDTETRNRLQGYGINLKVGDYVWVSFEHGDVEMPVIIGSWLPNTSFTDEKQVMQDRGGFHIELENGNRIKISGKNDDKSIVVEQKGDTKGKLEIDNKGNIQFTKKGRYVKLSDDEIEIKFDNNNIKVNSDMIALNQGNSYKIEIKNSVITIKGSKIKIDASTIELNSNNILLGSGAFERVVTNSVIPLINSHVHNVTAVGSPTTPPVPQITQGTSITTRVK